jgi:predicted membrane protein
MRDQESRNERIKRKIEERMQRYSHGHGSHGHVWTGLFLLVIGGLALVKSYGVPLPNWLFSWQMLLIAIGLFIGFRKNFTGGWFVPVIIGGAFMLNDFFMVGDLRRHSWPLIIIVIGLLFLFRPKRRHREEWIEKKNTAMPGETGETIPPVSDDKFSQDDFLDTTSIFGGTEKIVLSKNFKGGDMVNVFGGSEVNLTQADINGRAVLEVTCIFGGATLIVPPNWVVKSEAVTIFGGIGDKRRNIGNFVESESKVLILKGTVLFGGIEIKSY